nr:MAG TPA: Concanavalin A-like lectin/glucanase superfamily protein [Caudoviricetes sp.]
MNSAPFFKEREWSLLALQVWLNTQNNLENHGLGTMNITASSSPSYIDDKFGKSISMGDYCLRVPWEYDSEELTIALWVKPKTPRAWSDIFAIGEYDNRLEVNTTTGYYWFSDSKGLIGGNTCLFNLSNDKWHHIAFIIDGTSRKFYVNGSLIVEKTKVNNLSDIWGSNKSITIGSRIKGDMMYQSYMSDIRIYDNALSPREIKELAKGMICHYPLNDPYPTASINKYSGDFFEGRANGGVNDITCTKLTDERGYNYKYTYTGTGTNSWKSISFPVFNFTAGKKYDYSCKTRCNTCTSNVSFELRASRMDNDWARPKNSTVCSSSLADGKWREHHLIIQLEETSDRSGTTYKTNPILEFYTSAMATKDATFSFDFDLKDVQVSECDVDTPISNGAWNDGIVYDTSGYGNHGTMYNKDYISYNNDAPRYDGSCKLLNGAQTGIITPNFSFENMSQGTANLWINRHSTSNTWRTYLFFANGYNWTGNKYDFIIIGSTGAQAITMDCCSNTCTFDVNLNVWNMFTITWDLETHTAKYYLNGVLRKTVTHSNIDTEYASAHALHRIGNCYSEDSSSTSDYSISDFRMYATALSDQDIKELYNTPVSLTNTGTLMTQGEFKEM